MGIGSKLSLVFFGSGPVSAATLRCMISRFRVEAVITKPSTYEEMRRIASGIPVYAIANKAELASLVSSKKFESKLGLVVDFGIIISPEVVDDFDLGIVNSHFSLLPRWRGADPISFAILEGDKQTGVSLMLIDKSLDTGNLIAQEKLDIPPESTTPELTDRLIRMSNRMIGKYLPLYAEGKINPYPQSGRQKATYSRKLTKQDGRIDWQLSAEQIERQIRAFAGWPKSTGEINGHPLIITAAAVINKSGKPGGHEAGKNALVVNCGKNALNILSVQPPGKKEMSITAFLRGHQLN